MGRHSREHEQVYAVIRVDGPVKGPEHQSRIVVKEIVRSRELAAAEVDRLNRLNANKDCWYFSQLSRLFADGESFGTRVRADS